MRWDLESPRVCAGGAIALAHAGAIYGLLTIAPPSATSASPATIDVRFITQSEQREEWLPPEVKLLATRVEADEPVLSPVELPAAPAPDRAISTPQRISAAAAQESRAAPKLVSVVEYLRQPSPRYPPQSRRLREEGVVVLRVVIDERGHACEIEIESSSGYARLDRAAREAVAGAAFRPYLEDGSPRRALVLIPIEFSLNRGSA